MYNFSIRATDENGTGVSSYVPVSIEVISKNNTAPRPTVKFDFLENYFLILNLEIWMY
jgi:hypothetical protein